MNSDHSSKVSYNVIDIAGTLITKGSFHLGEGRNILQIAITNLKPSAYYLIIGSNGRQDVIPFLMQ